MTTPYADIRVREGRTLEEFEAPLIDVIGAAGASAWNDNPVQQLRRLSEQEELETGRVRAGRGSFMNPDHNMLDAETARGRLKEADIKYTVPDEGMSEAWLDTVIKRRQEKAARDDVLSRAGPGSMKWQLAASLGVSLLDPINVATAFIPVVGQARYARMVAGAGTAAGRAGVRAGVGAIEGAVGQAMLEPLTAYANSQEGIDYTMGDAIRNIAFGSLFGAGLHVGGGAIKDVVMARRAARGEVPELDLPAQTRVAPDSAAARAEGFTPQISEATLKAGVAQAVTGRQIDVDPIARLDPSQNGISVTDKGLEVKLDISKEPVSRSGGDQYMLEYTNPKNPDDVIIRAKTPDGQEIGYLDLAVKADRTAEVREVKVNPAFRRKGVATALQDEARAQGIQLKQPQEVTPDGEKFRDAYAARGEKPAQAKVSRAPSMEDMRRAAEANQRPEAAQGVDAQASRQADEQLAGAKKGDDPLADASEEARLAEQDLKETMDQLGGDSAKMMEKYNEDVKRANTYAKAARAAAVCNLRT